MRKFLVDIILKGDTKVTTIEVEAKNRLQAHNYLILNGIYGKQLEIREVLEHSIHAGE